MARRKVGDERIRKIQQSSGSYYIGIPMSLMRDLKWQEKQKVVIKKFGKKKLIISDWKK